MQIKAKATRNMDYLDSAATYCNIPLALSLDLSSDVRDDGIQYRAGLHQASNSSSPKVKLRQFQSHRNCRACSSYYLLRALSLLDQD